MDSVSFTIREGEIVGFLGPNGAGKSTLLKMISTWLEPNAGKIRVDGHDTQTEPLAVRRSLGYLPSTIPYARECGSTASSTSWRAPAESWDRATPSALVGLWSSAR